MGVVGSDDVVAVTKWCWVLNGLLLALECNPSSTANFVREKRDEQIRYVSITKLG